MTDVHPALVSTVQSGAEGQSPPTESGGAGREQYAAHLVDLMARSSSGHEEAFAELYDLTASRVYGVVLRVLRLADISAEVTEEVYVEVWRQSARYAPTKVSVLGWVTTMAHHRAVDRVRSATIDVAPDVAAAG